MYNDYLLKFHKTDIIKIIEDEDTTKHFSININFIVLYDHHSDLVVDLLNQPEKCLDEWDNAAIKTQMLLLNETEDHSQLKNNVHCRIYDLPALSAVRRTVFPTNDDAGKFLQVSGTVMRITAAKLLEYQRNYICATCKYTMLVKADYDKKYIIKQPRKCLNPEGCSSTNLVNFSELDCENCKDYQEIKIQEQVKKLGVGCIPGTMWVTLEDDLVDSCKPGDNVTICGVVKRRWGEFCKGNKIDIDIVLKANNVIVDNNTSATAAALPEVRQMFSAFWEKYSGNPLAGRDLILKSFCPQIYGLHLVKLAIAVVLAGGSQVENTSSGIRTRSESHLLLVGDPGTGKSQLLRFAAKIIPRSVLTTGVGSTAAGLTVTAMMENGEWQLEGGALVLSDGGVCCIDEFNSMKEHDRTSIHEAMEQQTISVAKASIVAKLNTRCSILAACNPKGNINCGQPLCMSVALPSPLLSRFDLILLLQDTVNQEWDTQVADYILNRGSNFSKLTDSDLWSTDILQSYFSVIRKLNLRLSEESETILSAYYQMQRRIDGRNKARTTVRLLESLVRLSQGHARLMYHKEVETMDSIYAIVLVDAAMEDESSTLDLNMSTHSVFPDCPTRDYRNLLETVLSKLGLRHVLDKELEVLGRIKNIPDVKSRFFHTETKFDEKNVEMAGQVVVEVEDNIRRNRGSMNLGSTGQNMVVIDDNSKDNENLEAVSDKEVDLNKEMKRKIQVVEEVSSNDLEERDFTAPGTSKTVAKKLTKKLKTSGANKSCSTEGENRLDVMRGRKTEPALPKPKKSFKIADDILDVDIDDGYDTLSFEISSSANYKVDKDEGNEKNINILKNSRGFGGNSVKETPEEGKCPNATPPTDFMDIDLRQTEENNEKSLNYSIKEKTKPVAGTSKTSVKDKLKIFKFVPKDNDSGSITINGQNRLESNIKDIKMDLIEKEIENTHEKVHLQPDRKGSKDQNREENQFSKPKNKFKFVKKPFNGPTSCDIVRNSSFELARRIFQTSDEDIDDIDLNI